MFDFVVCVKAASSDFILVLFSDAARHEAPLTHRRCHKSASRLFPLEDESRGGRLQATEGAVGGEVGASRVAYQVIGADDGACNS